MNKQFDIQQKFRFTVYVLLIMSLAAMGLSAYVFHPFPENGGNHRNRKSMCLTTENHCW
jgi:hypothetical protein